ncbi:TRAP transporter large permease [Falsirhodobacter sp. 1013]|uniref:TRAP transporter large permease n=1 Tax=Falsirhodobacter sp. 1013 TaxID=3417566 RepID=UPI003EC005E5
MSWELALLLMCGGLCAFFALGLPVALAFLAINMIGGWIFLGGEAGLAQMMRNTAISISSVSLTPIPMFILMGALLFHSGLAFRAITAVERLLTGLPGRLACVSVVGGTIFSGLSGSSIANTALLGSTLSPDMMKRGYHPTLAMGPIMAVGGIASLIPPSAITVMLGSLSGISISAMLIGGILPGLLMAAGFFAYVILRAVFDPTSAPVDPGAVGVPLVQRLLPFLRDVVPLLAIFVCVVGSMLGGVATPTESAALGALASSIAVAAYGRMSVAVLRKAAVETAMISVALLFILVGSTTFAQILSFSGGVRGFVEVVAGLGLSPGWLVLAMLVVWLALGTFLEEVSMMVITLPFFLPMAQAAGVDMVWLGLMMLVAIQIGMLSPPFGMLLMVMQGVSPATPMATIYRATLPFIGIETAVLALMFLVPPLALWLPHLIR